MLRRISKNVAVLDAFPKVEVENQQRSDKGGMLTILLTLILLLLTLAELRDYRKLNHTYEFLVDQHIDSKIQINVDLTIAMQCNALSVNVLDVAGERLYLTQNLHIVPTSFEIGRARPLGAGRQRELNIRRILKAARMNKAPDSTTIGSGDDGACRILGSFEVNKVNGNLHITSLGHGYSGAHTEHDAINFTHRIDEFSFGPLYPSINNPLDDSVEISNTHFEAFQYFISVVPTIYIDNADNTLMTNQYSVTDYRKTFDHENSRGMIPGLFFKYEIEAISVRITEHRQTFRYFIVRLCGILGGAFVTVGFAYRALRFIIDLPKGRPAPTGAGAAYIPTSNSEKRRL
ncbi:hypothetical protein BC938DRAFT_474494 [Jimgerdemannia flammicorona]|uniref:Endoplasmic reticulum vesicle transporter-domain-containing protein n=1 Tax=Jimgerdemannia flammicorona TaxID=994334 RepID=A0A433QSH7_9FUNG|nr:hypothetical protein BC938DRAFT_474494 [Jimgerdemannia flammicorona]